MPNSIPQGFFLETLLVQELPIATQIRRVLDDPFIPERFGIQKKGMQADSFAEGIQHSIAVKNWLLGRDIAALGAIAALGGIDSVDPNTGRPMLPDDLKEKVTLLEEELGYGRLLKKRLGEDTTLASGLSEYLTATELSEDIFCLSALDEPLHKQLAGRPLEPWMWQTVLVSGTEWSNFFALRNNPAAQPEIAKPAKSMQDAHISSIPQELKVGEWHTPIVGFEGDEDLSLEERKKASTGRGARVSFLTHGRKRDIQADFLLHDDLLKEGHMSPFEHQARPQTKQELAEFERLRGLVTPIHGNLRGFHQYRKDIPHEDDFGARPR